MSQTHSIRYWASLTFEDGSPAPGWYYRTREGDLIGPFDTKEGAYADLRKHEG